MTKSMLQLAMLIGVIHSGARVHHRRPRWLESRCEDHIHRGFHECHASGRLAGLQHTPTRPQLFAHNQLYPRWGSLQILTG